MLNMIEVDGFADKDGYSPLYMSFDGKIFEIIFRSGMHTDLARYPVGWLEKLEIEDNGDKGQSLKYKLKVPGPVGLFTFMKGGENLYQLVDQINHALNTI